MFLLSSYPPISVLLDIRKKPNTMNKYNAKTFELMKTQIETNGSLEITAFGNSMYPTIKDGERLTIIPQKEYSVGDIIAYVYSLDPLNIIIHRIICKRKNSVFTKGDNNNFIDKLVPNNKIMGIAIRIEDNQ